MGRERAQRGREGGGSEQEREGEAAGETGRRVSGLGFGIAGGGKRKSVSRGFLNTIILSIFLFFG